MYRYRKIRIMVINQSTIIMPSADEDLAVVRRQGQGLVNWSSRTRTCGPKTRTRTFLMDNNTDINYRSTRVDRGA